eukprot:g10842.t1
MQECQKFVGGRQLFGHFAEKLPSAMKAQMQAKLTDVSHQLGTCLANAIYAYLVSLFLLLVAYLLPTVMFLDCADETRANMASFEYISLDGDGKQNVVAPLLQRLTSLVGLGFLGGVGWIASRVSFFSNLTTHPGPRPFTPKAGVKSVLVQQTLPGPLQTVLLSSVQSRPSCLFSYGQLGPKQLHIGSQAISGFMEGWVYGAKLFGGLVASPTGLAADVIKGQLLCWQDGSLAAQLPSYHLSSHYQDCSVKRGVVTVVRKDGSSIRSFWYYVSQHPCPAAGIVKPMVGFILRDFCEQAVMEAQSVRQRQKDVPRRTLSQAGPSEESLSKEELGSRFRDVLAHFQASGELSDDKVKENMLRTRLPDLKLNRCEVKRSILHGQGVFATRDIAFMELITLYPGDALLLWGNESESAGTMRVLLGPHVVEKSADKCFVAAPGSRDYEIRDQLAGATISVVGDPALCSDPAYLGHMCNDGGALGLDGGDFKSQEARERYSRVSVESANAAQLSIEGCHFATVAIKPISKGEEVLISYGEGYWLSRAAVKAQDAVAKVEQEAEAKERAKKLPSKKEKSQLKQKSGGKEKNQGFGIGDKVFKSKSGTSSPPDTSRCRYIHSFMGTVAGQDLGVATITA